MVASWDLQAKKAIVCTEKKGRGGMKIRTGGGEMVYQHDLLPVCNMVVEPLFSCERVALILRGGYAPFSAGRQSEDECMLFSLCESWKMVGRRLKLLMAQHLPEGLGLVSRCGGATGHAIICNADHRKAIHLTGLYHVQ